MSAQPKKQTLGQSQSNSSRFSVASRTAFEALQVEGGESDDESEEEVLEEPKAEETAPVPPAEPTPVPESLTPPPEPTVATKGPKLKGKKAQASKAKVSKPANTANLTISSSPEPAQETPATIGSAISAGETILVHDETPNKPNGEPSPKPQTNKGPASAPTLTSAPPRAFQPALPELPSPHSPGVGLRKRKASHDLLINPLNKELKIEGEADDQPVASSEPQPPVQQDSVTSPNAEHAKKKQNAITRTIWTLIMIFGFAGLLSLGHPYVIMLVMACQSLVYREVTSLFTLTHHQPGGEKEDEGRDPWSKTLNWYFFAVTNYFLYGESIIYYFKHVIFAEAQFLPFATNHRFISFMLYTIGFMGFVASLKKQYLKQQFGLFCWVHMSLLVIVVSSHFIINNILEGLIWFWIPASLVICNDIFAYICGITFGRTPLIKLSPKKTVEGFVGAFICTLLFSVLWATIFIRFPYMTCPAHDLGTHAWSEIHCKPNSAFIWQAIQLPGPVNSLLSSILLRDNPLPPIPYAPFQLHALAMATFASLVAPFGGFFASGFKRAFNIKDFGDSIPGHGGMTDRMDCQFLMGMFSYVYYSSLVREHHATVGSILQIIVSSLTAEEQVELYKDLQRYLEGAGVSWRR